MRRLLPLLRRVSPLLLVAALSVSALPASARSHWEVGPRLDGLGGGRGEDAASESQLGLGGAGALLRWRHSPTFGMEVALDVLTGDDELGFSRELIQLDTALLAYLLHLGPFDVYLRGGLGTALSRWSDTATDTTWGTGSCVTAHVGVGSDLVLGRVRLFSDLRLMMLAPFGDATDFGAVPVGPEGVLYVRHPEQENRFYAADAGTEELGPFGAVMFSVGGTFQP